jgi:aspartate ammonia-lyase
MTDTRLEQDLLGTLEVPAQARYGIHTARALENFPLLHRPVHTHLTMAFGAVKLAAARTNRGLGYFPDAAKADGSPGGRPPGGRGDQHQHERQ